MGLLVKTSNTTGEERGTLTKSVLVAALSVALISTGLADPDRSSRGLTRGHRTAESGKGRATVVGANINVRSGPNINSSVVTKVSGASGVILAQNGDWFKIRFQYGTSGWVRQENLKISGNSSVKMIPIKLDPAPVIATKSSGKSSSSPKAKTVSASTENATRYVSLINKSVNIHAGPSASNSVQGRVRGGKAMVLDHRGDWFQVKFQYGTKGWVRTEAIVFPSNFDFKGGRPKNINIEQPTPVVAAKSEPVHKTERVATRLPENTVENTNTGERTSAPTEEATEKAIPASNSMMATVIGDGIVVRKGPSKSNSALMRVDGGRATIIDHRGEFYQLRFEHGTVGWVHSNYVSYPGHEVKEAPKLAVNSSDPDKASRLISNARTWTGVRYSYGSMSRGATDCSGFTCQVFKTLGIDLPRTARAQATRGTRVGRAQLQKGDLVFFNTLGFISHVGIYIGDSRFIHASSGKHKVTESSLNESYYGKVFLFGTRILPASKIKKLDLPEPGELPNTKTDGGNDENDNKVDIVKSGSGRD